MKDQQKVNATLVDALGSALRSGDHGLKTVPGLLKRVLMEESWREFTTQRGELVRYDRFEDFVVCRPLKGLGASVELVRRIVADDIEAAGLLEQALQRQHGGDRSKNDNVKLAPPTGNAQETALRRLRKDAPELHAEVLAGRLSAHAAMLQAGFRRRTVSIPVDDAEATARTLRKHLSPEALADLTQLLSAEAS
jgi:hypothetical protein